MKKILLILFSFLIFSFVSWGQIVYNTIDDFNRSDNVTLGTCSSRNSTWTEFEPTSDADQLSIAGNLLWAITSDTTLNEPTCASIDLTNENASFDFGNTTTGWSFHFDLNSNPSGWTTTRTSLGWVLLANETNFSSITIDGYAVVWNGTDDELVLTLFNDGISGSTNVGTPIIETGVDWDNISSDGINIRVDVTSAGIWTMNWEEGTAIETPAEIDANSLSSSATTTLFDDINMLYSGPIWSHPTGTQTGSFDNFTFGIETLNSVANPSNFTTTTASTSQIDLSWSQNENSNNVLVAFTQYEAVAGNPVNGNAYAADNILPGGGTVIYVGSLTSFNHTSLDASSYYHYKVWSVDDNSNYSSGVNDNAATLTPEPTNHITNLLVGTISSFSITLNWDTIAGGVEADGYYLFVNIVEANLPAPVDGTEISGDTDFSNGDGSIIVTNEIETYTWTGLSAETTYFFSIYPYTNTDNFIDYKTNGTIPQTNAITLANVTATIFISEVSDPLDIYQTRFIELYNVTASTIDFSSQVYFLCRQTNGSPTSWEDKQLTGSINPGETYVLAQSNDDESDYFYQSFGFLADYNYGGSSGNGDDGYFLYSGGDHSTGILIDAYGVVDEDGTGKDWEYTNSKAVRKTTVTSPNTTWTATEWNIVGAGTARMSPGSYPTSVWNGSIDNTWADASNWDNGQVSSTINAIIWNGATNYPTITSSISLNNLTIESDASLLGAENLTINGTATVKRSLNDSLWQYITPPTTKATANDIEITTSGQYAYLLQYNNDVSGSGAYDSTLYKGWEYLTHDTDSLIVGKGYGVWVTENKEINFSGTLVAGNQIITGISSGDSGNNPWVLIGNSALAHLDWTSITDDDDITTSAYFYDGTNSRYATITQAGGTTNTSTTLIPPLQGFFVEVDASGDTNLTLPTSALTHGSQAFYKSVKLMRNKVRLAIQKGQYTDETLIYFDNDAKNNYEPHFDAHKLLITTPGIPQLYSQADEHNLAINVQNETPASIPLCIHSSENIELTINILEIENIDKGISVTIEDRITGRFYNLINTDNIKIQVAAGENADRFVLHYTNSTLSVTEQSKSTKIYSKHSTIIIERTSPKIAKMKIYSLSGQLVYCSIINSNKSEIETQLPQGVYLVDLLEDNGQTIQKVTLNY